MRHALALLVCLAASATTAADDSALPSLPDQPDDARLALWELGVGIGAAITPDYPSASGTTARALPVPVVIYRGDFFRLGDGSVASGRLFRNERLEFDVSLNGSFDAESDDVDARAGMPDLGFGFEIGPELEITLSDPAIRARRLKLELPVRAAFSVDDGDLNERGYVFSPQLEYEHQFGDGRYEWSVSLTPTFATEALHDYFYEVAPQFANATRPAYDADGGYLQTSLGIGLQRRTEKSFAAIGMRYTSLDAASNVGSPLFRSRTDFSVAAIVIVRLWESKRRAAD